MTRMVRVVLLVALSSLFCSSLFGAEPAWRTVLPLDGRAARTSESTLGDLVADSARAAVFTDAAGKTTQADLALLQTSQIRLDLLPAGDLTEAKLTGTLLFPDEQVVLVEMPGWMVVEALERGLSFLPRPSTSFLQVSGLTASYRPKGPAGRRIVEVKVGADAIVPAQVYRVAMPSSLAKGGMGYYRVFNGLKVKLTGPTLGQALGQYLRANPIVNIPPGQRLLALPEAPEGQ
jgi:5'-nucleotidase / UDP-sugar diphosphatase